MSIASVPKIKTAVENFLFDPDFPTELKFEILGFVPVGITIFGDLPPLLLALHGTPFYRFVQAGCRRVNFFLTNKTMKRFLRTNNSHGLGNIQYLYISTKASLPRSVFHNPMRAHVSMLANNFVEINLVLKTSSIDNATSCYHWTYSIHMVDLITQLAARSTAFRTVVRFRIVLLAEARGQSLQSRVQKVMAVTHNAQERYTTRKTWSVLRNVFRGVNPVQEVWVCEAVKD